MRYLSVKFTLSAEDIQPMLLEAVHGAIMYHAAEAGFESFEEEGGVLTGYVQQQLYDEAQLQSLLAETFPMQGIEVSLTVIPVEQEDWNAAWESEGFDPIIIDDRCQIHDTRHLPPLRDGVLDIVIDARMAFGSGTHETTRMMVEALLSTELSGKRVLDCGCGTGILSIVAAKRGAAKVFAYDIDEWSADNTRHNAVLNGVDNIEVAVGDVTVLSSREEKYDVVVANINRNILLADMPALRSVMVDSGRLIISGFYVTDITQLVDKAESLGLTLQSTSTIGDWSSLSFCQTSVLS